MKKRRTQAEAPTSVFWDIDKCPVPSGFDARQVFPCIKRFLKNLGYSGPLTITAVGNLTNVPRDIIRVLSSTGIYLTHTVSRFRDVTGILFHWSADIEPPINVMVISTLTRDYTGFSVLRDWGFKVIYCFPHSNFMVPGPLEEDDKCSDTVGWKCTVCYDRTGLGAESLIKHLSSPKHKRNFLELLPLLPPCGCVCSIHTPVEAPLLDSTMVEKQPKAKNKNSGYLMKTKVLWKYKKKLKYKLEEEE